MLDALSLPCIETEVVHKSTFEDLINIFDVWYMLEEKNRRKLFKYNESEVYKNKHYFHLTPTNFHLHQNKKYNFILKLITVYTFNYI